MAATGGKAARPVPDAAAHHRRWVVPAVVVAILGLVAILVLQDIANRHAMEGDLASRAAAALHQAGLDDAQVVFSGRDGSVWVPTSDETSQALAVVQAVDGVRVVHVFVGTPGGAAAAVNPTPSPTLTLIATPSAAPSSAPSSAPSATPPSASPTATPSPAPPATPTPTPTGTPSAGAADVQAQLNALPAIRFANDQATLDTAAKRTLAKVAAIMLANPDVHLLIEGNADSVGSAASNLVLSRARAKAVSDALAALGVPASQMSTVGYGETRPVAPNDSPRHRALNRRVDFKAE